MKKYIQYTHTCTLDGSLSSLKTFILKHCFIFNAVKTKFGEKCMKTSGLLFLLFVFSQLLTIHILIFVIRIKARL